MKEEPIIMTTDHQVYRVHQLKTVEPYFSAVKNGDKTFEIRKFDRDFQLGDILWLTHYDAATKLLGEAITRIVTYMLTDAPYVPEGYVVLGMVEDNIYIDF
jgi:hypothetical protein